MKESNEPRITEIDFSHYPDVERHRASLLDIAERCGTPVMACERENLASRFERLKKSLEARWPQHVIGYSFKTNYLVAESGIFQRLGGWAEVVSGREYRMARRLGYPGRKIIFNGPYKTSDELRTAIGEGARLNVNDEGELERVIEIAKGRQAPVEIGLRLAAKLPHIGHSRFGFSLDHGEAADAVQRAESSGHVNVTSFHMHLYADTDDAELYRMGVHRVGEFLQASMKDYQERLTSINLGGGFPAHIRKPKSRSAWDPQPIETYVDALTDGLRTYFPDGTSQPVLMLEPGRFLTSDGIVLMTNVVFVKERDGVQYVNSNGSISMVPLTHYCPQIIRAFDSDLSERREGAMPTVIYGSTCRENDVLYEGAFPKVAQGDYLIHFGVGAYNSSLSPDFIFPAPSLELF